MAGNVVVIDNDRQVMYSALEGDDLVVQHPRTRHMDDCLQEILDRGRFGFWMIMLRASPPENPPIA